jgi:hypothetical protein
MMVKLVRLKPNKQERQRCRKSVLPKIESCRTLAESLSCRMTTQPQDRLTYRSLLYFLDSVGISGDDEMLT